MSMSITINETIARFEAWNNAGGFASYSALELEDGEGGSNYDIESIAFTVSDSRIIATIKLSAKADDGEDLDYLEGLEDGYGYDSFPTEEALHDAAESILDDRGGELADLVARVDLYDALVTALATNCGVERADIKLVLALNLDTTVTDSTVVRNIRFSYRDWLDEHTWEPERMASYGIRDAYNSFLATDAIKARLVSYLDA